MLGRQEFSATQMILPGDSAVGPAADWTAYQQDWDPKHLDLIPGVLPTTFLVHQLGEDPKRGLAPLGYGLGVDSITREGALMVIRCALKDWENYQVLKVGGVCNVDRPTGADWEDRGILGRILTDAAVRRLGLIFSQWRNLYQLIVLFSEPALPLSRPSAPLPGQ